ncbi:hypothetical protein KAI92_02650 [Candidatus Parcubacteria bacterium]|nr:hypothetical protein [Candidatus Parcubacteria bacterium]
MKILKLLLICCSVIILNFSFVYILFYWQTIFSSININNTGNFLITLNHRGDTAIYWQMKNEKPFLCFFDIENNKYQDYSVSIKHKIMHRDNLNISLDDNFIFFNVKEERITTKYYFNINTKKTGRFSELFNVGEYFRFDSGNSTNRSLSFGKEYLLFEASNKERGAPELVVYSLKRKKIIDTIKSARLATMSSSEKSFAYIQLRDGGRAFDVYKYDLENKSSKKLYGDFKDYAISISWSLDDSKIAVSYQVNDDKMPVNEVSIIGVDKSKFDIGEKSNFFHPIWLDNDNLIMIKYEERGAFMKYKTVKGAYLYNISKNKASEITDRVVNNNIFLSPKKKYLFFSANKKLQRINIQEMQDPNLLNQLRNWLGVIKL